MRWALLLIVLTFTGVATAAPPEGFRESAPLTKRAAKIAPDAKVYCAKTTNAWVAYTLKHYPDGSVSAAGLTTVETREIHLAPFVCWVLTDWLRGRRWPDGDLAFSIYAFIHESAHAKGIRNECAADQFALQKFTYLTRTLFGIRNFQRLRELRRLAKAKYDC